VIAPEAVIRADHALAGERLGEVAAHVFRYLARRSEVFPPPAPKSQNKPCEATRRAGQFFCVIHGFYLGLIKRTTHQAPSNQIYDLAFVVAFLDQLHSESIR